MEFGFFGTLLILMGLIIGLGAVTVIDIHGFLGRKSSYWTLATTRTHKITKPLIWAGIFLFTLGILFTYKGALLWSQIGINVILILNGLFLSYVISPYLLKREKQGLDKVPLHSKVQKYIGASMIVSFLGWWISVMLLVSAIS